ncbi:hypothetical protein NDU88_007720 [Pleurodeles waltl]|uniref:Uncharacterized protein n=1 Tax=Pleurodeles waltl TaxID=8319 RepID=A0AAV7NTY8_PLEWA|nr:hypothetical protein NDU88_007720 [Pleurodeles waltl]
MLQLGPAGRGASSGLPGPESCWWGWWGWCLCFLQPLLPVARTLLPGKPLLLPGSLPLLPVQRWVGRNFADSEVIPLLRGWGSGALAASVDRA